MIDETISMQWSMALYELVVQENKIKVYNSQAGILITLFKKYPEIINVLNSSVLPFSDKEKIIKTTFSDFLPYIVNLMLLLALKNYFRYIIGVLKEFRRHCNAYYGIEYGVVYSVVDLSSEQMAKLEKKVSLLTNYKVELVNKIDESLIAGVKVKVKNQVFDGSIKGQIDQLKNELLKNNN